MANQTLSCKSFQSDHRPLPWLLLQDSLCNKGSWGLLRGQLRLCIDFLDVKVDRGTLVILISRLFQQLWVPASGLPSVMTTMMLYTNRGVFGLSAKLCTFGVLSCLQWCSDDFMAVLLSRKSEGSRLVVYPDAIWFYASCIIDPLSCTLCDGMLKGTQGKYLFDSFWAAISVSLVNDAISISWAS